MNKRRKSLAYWIREFKNNATNQRYRITSEISHLAILRLAIAKKLESPEWENEVICKHEPLFGLKLAGSCPELAIERF